MQYSHELIMPNKDLPFKMFLFEGKDGNYFRDKHWHRSIEIFAVLDGGLVFHIGDRTYPLSRGEFILVNSNEIHSCRFAKTEPHRCTSNTAENI